MEIDLLYCLPKKYVSLSEVTVAWITTLVGCVSASQDCFRLAVLHKSWNKSFICNLFTCIISVN